MLRRTVLSKPQFGYCKGNVSSEWKIKYDLKLRDFLMRLRMFFGLSFCFIYMEIMPTNGIISVAFCPVGLHQEVSHNFQAVDK